MIETKGKLKDTKPEESNGKEPISTHDEDLCTICANEFQWYGIGECNHPVCHICMLRMRALYKSTFCPICKTDCQTVIFTDHANQLFSTFNTTSFKRDKKLGIYFQTPVMYDETMVLLSFNCPDPECSTVCGGGWADLTNHVKKAHKSLLCQLCIKYKKVFTHESIMFSSEELRKHNKVGDPDADGFIGHPECGFCHVRYYSHDELYDHCREAHEQCFLCMRVGIQNQYYTNYEALEEHFGTEHFRCLESKCLEQKFVVFATEIDLHGHQLDVHADAKTKSKGKTIQLDFNYAGSATTRTRAEESKRERNRRLQKNDDSNSAPSTSRPVVVHEEYPSLGNRSRRAPAGFGQLSSPAVSNVASVPGTRSFVPAPAVGQSSISSTYNPTPSELRGLEPEQVSLTPTQANILSFATPELVSLIHKLFLNDTNTIAKFKISMAAFKAGNITAVKHLNDSLQLAITRNSGRRKEAVITDFGKVWVQIADSLPDQVPVSETLLASAVSKKSKKKGLSIAEFEALQRDEPKQTAMLRVWKDYKVKMKQESDDIPQKASSNWAQEPSSSKTPKAAAKPTPARVLVIKSKTTAVGASSQWAGARTKPKERKPAPVEFRNGIGALVRNDSQNSLHSNSSQSDNSLAPTPSQSSSKPTLKDAITKPTKSVLASSELFPELPTVNKKPTRATSSRQRNAPSSTPPSKWGNNDQQEEFSEVQSSSKKKGKQVLIHFG